MALFGLSGFGTLAFASVTALGLAYAIPGGVAATPEVELDLTPVGSVAASAWRLTNHASGAACEARPGPRISGGDHALIMDERCSDVLAGLGEPVLWREARDGTIAFAGASGRLVVSFAQMEGEALQSIEPNEVMLSLSAL